MPEPCPSGPPPGSEKPRPPPCLSAATLPIRRNPERTRRGRYREFPHVTAAKRRIPAISGVTRHRNLEFRSAVEGHRPRRTRRKDDGVPLRRILRHTPWPVRRRLMAGMQQNLLRYLPAERRLATARRLVPLTDATGRRGRAGYRRFGPFSGGGRGGWLGVAVRVTDRATPAGVRRENLDRVVTALETAAIEWFRVPVDSLTGSAVAVREEDRNRVIG